MKKINKIPTIIGIIILIAGIFGGVFALNQTTIFKIGANTSAAPKDIRVSNLTDSSATISWITGTTATSFINWGETRTTLTKIENESQNEEKFFTHEITLSGLKANTTYFYKINSNGANFDNSGTAWQFTTGISLSGNQTSIPVSGTVISATGEPAKRALVYIEINGYILSTLTSNSGNFVLQLGQVRTSDLKSFAKINLASTLLQVSIKAENGEVASAQIYPQSANPIPSLILGQVQDYRNLPPTENGQNPNANLDLPQDASQASKFDTSIPTKTLKPVTVVLESISQGETVTTDQPEFFGKGPVGETITITIHSDQVITDTVKVPSNGSWSYSPDVPLSEGTHSVTISWFDISGIARTLTRNFIVQAGEIPAFTASKSAIKPSATPKPTATATAKPGVTPTIKPSVSPTITPKLTTTPTATPMPLPITGNSTTTLLLFIVGLTIISFSLFVWKKAEN